MIKFGLNPCIIIAIEGIIIAYFALSQNPEVMPLLIGNILFIIILDSFEWNVRVPMLSSQIMTLVQFPEIKMHSCQVLDPRRCQSIGLNLAFIVIRIFLLCC